MAPRIRSWQFVHPDFDRGEDLVGLRLSPRGGIAMVEDDEAIRQSILLLMSTMPGERVMRPDYGCDLYRLAFSPNDEAAAGLAIHYVRQALARWEPRVEVLDLDATRNPERPERLEIVLHYRLRASQQLGEMTYSFSLSGEEV